MPRRMATWFKYESEDVHQPMGEMLEVMSVVTVRLHCVGNQGGKFAENQQEFFGRPRDACLLEV